MILSIPELSLVVLIGASGSGKSTFAAKHFLPSEVLSSDDCRQLVADDPNDQAATHDAFDVLHFIASKRLGAGRLTVVDATNVQREARAELVALARRYHCLPVAIVLDVPQRVCERRNRDRPDRDFGPHVIRRQMQQLHRGLNRLEREGFRHIHILRSDAEIDAAQITRTKLWCDRRTDTGPFDIIGDVHGCADELEALLTELDYQVDPSQGPAYRHPEGRTAVFLGDLVDRGPWILKTLDIVRAMVEAGTALCVPGNHDTRLVRKLRGRDVRVTYGLDRTLAEIEARAPEERDRTEREIATFLHGLTSHYVLDGGKLVVAHAGMREEMQGRGSGKVRDFALYGETTGETDEFGLPIRYDWAAEYRGQAIVVYGHTPVPEPEWVNRTINIDTGCVFGGRLTALRYPEIELVSVRAQATYAEPVRPLTTEPSPDDRSTQHRLEDVLDIRDVYGKQIVPTRLAGSVTIREEQSAAALEVVSRFAIDPKWLIYLPPTMSPPRTTSVGRLLEHPAEVFAYFRAESVQMVVCQEKHMGSRAVLVVCRDPAVARTRFGVAEDAMGACYTRTGRRFFLDDAMEAEVLERIARAAGAAGLWDELGTDWLCLDAEIMPWTVKAHDLIRDEYAAVGAAATAAMAESLGAVSTVEVAAGLRDHLAERACRVSAYVDAYRRYCGRVEGIGDVHIAPFHLLASEAAVHVDRDHRWHMEILARLCRDDDELLLRTPYRPTDVTDATHVEESTRWWEELTGNGGEGVVVKPLEFVVQGRRGLVQPGVKCRGAEYLRIIYGPEYDAPGNLERLRDRKVGLKQSLAVREFALGVEALERFVRREPLRRVHQCVFGVLALETEPVDPRL